MQVSSRLARAINASLIVIASQPINCLTSCQAHSYLQVSRRLARAINASLVVIASQPLAARELLQGFAADPGMAPGPTAVVAAEAGHVRLAVQTYTRLLASLSTSDCNLMAQELICTKPVRKQSAFDKVPRNSTGSLPSTGQVSCFCPEQSAAWVACCSTSASDDQGMHWNILGRLHCKA